MSVYTIHPANIGQSVALTEFLYPVKSAETTLSGSSVTLEDILGGSISKNSGAAAIIPKTDINIAFGEAADSSHAVIPSNDTYTIRGYKRILDSINILGTGDVGVILYATVDDLDTELMSSSSSSSSSSESSESSSSSSSSA